jgi:hypothetical protein
MQEVEGLGLNSESYGVYSGFSYSITFIPMLLFAAPLVDSTNRRCVLGFCTLSWGLCTALQGMATKMI